MQSSDDKSELRFVDPESRVALDRFPQLDEAELACGLLRSHNIPCELSSEVLPGLPSDIILWVNALDVRLAWAVLFDTERDYSGDDKVA